MTEDEILKVYFSDSQRFADLMNGLNFAGKQVVHPEDVQEQDGQEVFFRVGFWEKTLGRMKRRSSGVHIRDMVRKVVFGAGFAIVGVENQENVDYSIPLRLMLYDVGEYEKQAVKIRRAVRNLIGEKASQGRGLQKNNAYRKLSQGEFLYRFRREDKLHPVATFLLYYGVEEWQGPRSLHDMLDFRDIPKEMKEFISDYKVNLIEIRKLTNTEVFHTDIKQVFDFIRYSEEPEQLKKLIENDEAYSAIAEDAYDVIAAYTNAKEFIEQKEEFQEGGHVNMCKAIQEWMKSSREEGREEGLEQGMDRTTLLIEKMTAAGETDKLSQLSNRDFLQEMLKKYGL